MGLIPSRVTKGVSLPGPPSNGRGHAACGVRRRGQGSVTAAATRLWALLANRSNGSLLGRSRSSFPFLIAAAEVDGELIEDRFFVSEATIVAHGSLESRVPWGRPGPAGKGHALWRRPIMDSVVLPRRGAAFDHHAVSDLQSRRIEISMIVQPRASRAELAQQDEGGGGKLTVDA